MKEAEEIVPLATSKRAFCGQKTKYLEMEQELYKYMSDTDRASPADNKSSGE
jgi:hypothetical protein